MVSSYNGWPAGKGWSVAGGQLQALVVDGEPFSPGVRAGDVHDVLEYVANQVSDRVEPVFKAGWHAADDWGYSYRANTNNPSQLSCHASGTAIDYNATQHPNGRGGTWSAGEKAEILRILAEVDNVVRVLWGYDEMHFEICKGPVAVAAAAARVRRHGSTTAVPVSGNAVVLATQRAVNFTGTDLDGIWGPATEHRVNLVRLAINGQFLPGGVDDAQVVVGTRADGKWGPISQDALVETIEKLQAAWGTNPDGDWGSATEAAWLAARAANYKP